LHWKNFILSQEPLQAEICEDDAPPVAPPDEPAPVEVDEHATVTIPAPPSTSQASTL